MISWEEDEQVEHLSASCQDNALPAYTCSLYSQALEPKKHLLRQILGCVSVSNINLFIFLSFWLQRKKHLKAQVANQTRDLEE